ncbi:Protein adenylyltransferase SelO [Camellia lanceoleosa]|uniref:Protein adenylyltransferase SelO n=1 Tax=Camellia lanceoleosa TaxID=1840588 RepID=A0ACC0G3R2_9ERIC|nr:Protein adenylyltransferase SelO [Camellia lanceoleosa]
MFYDGNPKDEPGAIVYRVAQSFLRFGSYQIHASRGKEDLDIVRTLADYIIRHHFPHIENMSKSESLSFNTGMEDDSVVINLVVWDKHSSFVDCGVAVDLWSAGCILAELYARKPIMPGRTEMSSLFYDKNIRVNNIRKYIDHLGSSFKSLSFDHVEQLHRTTDWSLILLLLGKLSTN